jgi:hypothetical protein
MSFTNLEFLNPAHTPHILLIKLGESWPWRIGLGVDIIAGFTLFQTIDAVLCLGHISRGRIQLRLVLRHLDAIANHYFRCFGHGEVVLAILTSLNKIFKAVVVMKFLKLGWDGRLSAIRAKAGEQRERSQTGKTTSKKRGLAAAPVRFHEKRDKPTETSRQRDALAIAAVPACHHSLNKPTFHARQGW